MEDGAANDGGSKRRRRRVDVGEVVDDEGLNGCQ